MNNTDTNLLNEKKILAEAEKIIKQANEKELKVVKKTNVKKKIIITFSILLILIILFTLTFIFGLVVSQSENIISGISINNIDVSGLTKSQAIEKLNSNFSNKLSSDLTLPYGDYTTTLNLESIKPELALNSAVDTAYNIGRSEGNIFLNNLKIVSTKFNKKNLVINVNFNAELFSKSIENINNEIPDKVVNSSYKIDGSNLIVENSANGYKIQDDLLKKNLENAILNNESTVQIPLEQFEAEAVDILAIYNAIHKDAVDAYFTTNPYEIHKEEEGLDFAISIEDAQKLVSQDQATFTIPLKVLKPKVTVKNLSQEAFPDLLASYSTSYATSSANRCTNVELATKSINGYVLMPGETFSYNDTVGQRTAARGYKEAGVYLNGEVTTGLGGGICQVSSTLYNAVLLSNLEIVERTNHTFKPSYVPAGQDATVSWGAPDFKFKNNRNYPIKISATTSGKNIYFNIYGLKTDDDYEVKIVSNQVGTVPYTTSYQNTSSLPSGTQKVIQSGSNGCKTETYKILYKNGTEVSRTRINADTYKAHNQVISVGTAQSQNTNDSTVTIE